MVALHIVARQTVQCLCVNNFKVKVTRLLMSCYLRPTNVYTHRRQQPNGIRPVNDVPEGG